MNYVQTTFNIISDVLRLYFNRIDAVFLGLLGKAGGKYIGFPYAMFQALADQTNPGANTPAQVTLDTTADSNEITLTTSDITVGQPGVYSFKYTMQFNNSDAASHAAVVWLMLNGADVVNTANLHTVPVGISLASGEMLVTVGVADTLELWWAVDSALVTLDYDAASAAPYTRPAIPAVTCVITFVSNPLA